MGIVKKCVLNEKCPPLSEHLDAWSLVGSPVWVCVGSVAFLDEVCHRGWVLKYYKTSAFLVCSLCSTGAGQDVRPQFLAPAAMPAACCHSSLP